MTTPSYDVSFTKYVNIFDKAVVNKDFNIDVYVKGNSAMSNATADAVGYNTHTETLTKAMTATPDHDTHLGYSGSVSESVAAATNWSFHW